MSMTRWVKPLGVATLALLALSVILLVGAAVWDAKLASEAPQVTPMSTTQWSLALQSGQEIPGLAQLAESLKWESDHQASLTAITWMRRVGIGAAGLFSLTLLAFVVVALTSIAGQRSANAFNDARHTERPLAGGYADRRRAP